MNIHLRDEIVLHIRSAYRAGLEGDFAILAADTILSHFILHAVPRPIGDLTRQDEPVSAQGVEAGGRDRQISAHEKPTRRDAPASPPSPLKRVPGEITEAIEAVVTRSYIHGFEVGDNTGAATEVSLIRRAIEARSTLDATILHYLSAARARAERAEKALEEIRVREAAEAEQIATEQAAQNIAYLRANIAQMERFMERGEEADPIGYMQWRDRRDRFQRELDAALSPTQEP